jgi:DNA polymerase-3 subunit epsilon
MFYDAHRADVNCFALLEVLQQKLLKSEKLVFKCILDLLIEKSYVIFAIGSPFETKDTPNAREYRWDADKKSWHITVNGEDAVSRRRQSS